VRQKLNFQIICLLLGICIFTSFNLSIPKNVRADSDTWQPLFSIRSMEIFPLSAKVGETITFIIQINNPQMRNVTSLTLECNNKFDNKVITLQKTEEENWIGNYTVVETDLFGTWNILTIKYFYDDNLVYSTSNNTYSLDYNPDYSFNIINTTPPTIIDFNMNTQSANVGDEVAIQVTVRDINFNKNYDIPIIAIEYSTPKGYDEFIILYHVGLSYDQIDNTYSGSYTITPFDRGGKWQVLKIYSITLGQFFAEKDHRKNWKEIENTNDIDFNVNNSSKFANFDIKVGELNGKTGLFIGLIDKFNDSISVKDFALEIKYAPNSIKEYTDNNYESFNINDDCNGKILISSFGNGNIDADKLCFVPISLTGEVNDRIYLNINSVNTTDLESNLILCDTSNLIFNRGKVLNNGETSVGVEDAIAGLQYLAGIRDVGLEGEKVNVINMASILNSDKPNVKDVIALMQYLVGIRDERLNLITPLQ